jgi:glyoxylate carboligase
MTDKSNEGQPNGAQLVVRALEAQGVTHVFGIPGAKIDAVFNALVDSKIQTVVCRHEQNAAMIAGGIGRMTGKAGVAIATSGPGVSNLVTGLSHGKLRRGSGCSAGRCRGHIGDFEATSPDDGRGVHLQAGYQIQRYGRRF